MDSQHADKLTLCAIQPAVLWSQPLDTFKRIETLVSGAARKLPLDVIVLPEHFNATIEDDGENAQWHAAQEFAADLARRYAINLVAGSVEQWAPALGGRINTAIVYDRWGQELGRYDKRRLFGFERRRNVLPGSRALTVTIEGIPTGVLICADLWFPEQVREIASSIDVLLVPAQTTIRAESQPSYARMLWQTLAMTRAQENVLAVVVSDQAASSQAPYRCGGVSSITDPSAEPHQAEIQQTLRDGDEGVVIATIDLAQLRRFRSYRRDNGLLPALA